MFCVESQEEREEWIAAIQLVSDELKNSDEGAEGPPMFDKLCFFYSTEYSESGSIIS
jgi:hypothetical protein